MDVTINAGMWNYYKTALPRARMCAFTMLDWTELNLWNTSSARSPNHRLYFDRGEGKRYRSLGVCLHPGRGVDAKNVDEIVEELRTGSSRTSPNAAAVPRTRTTAGTRDSAKDGYM